MTPDDLEEVRVAVDQLASAFEQIENIVKSLDHNDKKRFLNPETFGPISAFLGRGAGYEPAFRSSEFHDSDELLEIVEEYVDFDDEDLTDDEDISA